MKSCLRHRFEFSVGFINLTSTYVTPSFEIILTQIPKFYWLFNNYVALYELQEFKECQKLPNKHHKNIIKNVKHCFILNGKELPIHYSTIADAFYDVFVM